MAQFGVEADPNDAGKRLRDPVGLKNFHRQLSIHLF